MAQHVKGLVTKPDDLSLIHSIHTVEGKSQLPQIALCPAHMLCHMHILLQKGKCSKHCSK